MSFCNGDRVCALEGSVAEFGRITETRDVDKVVSALDLLRSYGDVIQERIGLQPRKYEVQGPTSPVVVKRYKETLNRSVTWDKNGKQKTPILNARDEQNYRLVDRVFAVGDHVEMKGRRGKVLEVVPLATVRICDTDLGGRKTNLVITDLDLKLLHPITHLFAGVTVEFRGWIGQVVDVERETTYKLQNGLVIRRKMFDSLFQTTPKHKKKVRTSGLYPFSSEIRDIPMSGVWTRFSTGEVEIILEKTHENVGRITRSTSQSSETPQPLQKKLVNTDEFINAIVESVHILSVELRWTGRLPGYLIKPEEETSVDSIPGCLIRSPEDINQLRPLYISACSYFDKKGLCVLHHETNNPEQTPIPERKWNECLFNAGGEKFNPQAITMEDKEKDVPAQMNGKRQIGNKTRAIIVYKHFVRHNYKVSFDDHFRHSNYVRGTELKPVGRKNYLYPHPFVVPKQNSPMYQRCDYGVVIDSYDDNLVVDWVKVESIRVTLVCRSQCTSLSQVSSHPTFNSLRENRVVVKQQEWKEAVNFRFGTVVSVNRFALGQIIVHCADIQSKIPLWPHLITVFEGMSIKCQLEKSLIGTRLKSP